MRITPTIGRVVWYWSGHNGSNQAEAAHVAYVHSDAMVNLLVVGHDGRPRPETSVPLRQPEEGAPANSHYCEWMPFQVGQAARHEAKAEPEVSR